MLERLSRQTVLPGQVIVVDNGGTLTEQDLGRYALSDRSRLVTRADNPGYGAAVNEARGVRSSALLVLTHDADFDADLAERLLQALDAETTAGAAAPVLHLGRTTDRIFSAGGTLTAGGRAGHLRTLTSTVPYPVDWVDGAVVLYRRSALDEIDWIDEGYFLYFEDVDTAWRMRRAGRPTLVVPDSIAAQRPGAHPMYLGIRNMTLFARRAGIPLLPHLAAISRRVLEESAARVLRGRSPELGAALRGWRDGRRGRSGKPAR